MGGVTHHPRDFRPNRLDRLHPRFRHIVLKRGGHLVQALQNTAKVIAVMGRQQQLIASQHQFANRVNRCSSTSTPTRTVAGGGVVRSAVALGGRRASARTSPRPSAADPGRRRITPPVQPRGRHQINRVRPGVAGQGIDQPLVVTDRFGTFRSSAVKIVRIGPGRAVCHHAALGLALARI